MCLCVWERTTSVCCNIVCDPRVGTWTKIWRRERGRDAKDYLRLKRMKQPRHNIDFIFILLKLKKETERIFRYPRFSLSHSQSSVLPPPMNFSDVFRVPTPFWITCPLSKITVLPTHILFLPCLSVSLYILLFFFFIITFPLLIFFVTHKQLQKIISPLLDEEYILHKQKRLKFKNNSLIDAIWSLSFSLYTILCPRPIVLFFSRLRVCMRECVCVCVYLYESFL